jgi:hypothetical protein
MHLYMCETKIASRVDASSVPSFSSASPTRTRRTLTSSTCLLTPSSRRRSRSVRCHGDASLVCARQWAFPSLPCTPVLLTLTSTGERTWTERVSFSASATSSVATRLRGKTSLEVSSFTANGRTPTSLLNERLTSFVAETVRMRVRLREIFLRYKLLDASMVGLVLHTIDHIEE